MSHFLDDNGVQYMWNKIKGMFAQKTDVPSASSTTPSMDGTASTGTGTTWARADHVHPTDTSRAPLASPTFTGTPTAPTPADATDNGQIATTEFVHNLVDGIQGGDSFGKVKVGNTTVEADSADDTIELIAGSNVTLTPDATNDTVTITATDTTYSNATTATAGLMSTTDKTKMDGIASGAEVNQNAFSNVKVGATTVEADSKTDTIEFIAGANVTITPDATNDTVTITSQDTTYSNATTATAGLMSTTDKSKLDGFQAASNYALKSDVSNVYKYKGSVATESLLPTTGQENGDVYDIVAASSYGAPGMNVAWVAASNKWDPLGETFTITAITNAEIDEICV